MPVRQWRRQIKSKTQVRMTFHEPAGTPRGFGVRQSSGAFGSGPRAQKRQRTAAVQDASAPAAASSRFIAPMHARERKEAFHEPEPGAPAPPGPASQENVNRAGLEPRAPIPWFMAPMPARKRKEDFHEPKSSDSRGK